MLGTKSRSLTSPHHPNLPCPRLSTIAGSIDQVNQVLELAREPRETRRYHVVDLWARQLSSLHATVINRMM